MRSIFHGIYGRTYFPDLLALNMAPADGGRMVPAFHVDRMISSRRERISTGTRQVELPDTALRAEYQNILRDSAEVRARALIASSYSPEQCFEMQHFFARHHSIMEWVSAYEDIALRLSGKPLFLGSLPVVGHAMTWSVFDTGYAPNLAPDPQAMKMIELFFTSLREKAALQSASENVN